MDGEKEDLWAKNKHGHDKIYFTYDSALNEKDEQENFQIVLPFDGACCIKFTSIKVKYKNPDAIDELSGFVGITRDGTVVNSKRAFPFMEAGKISTNPTAIYVPLAEIGQHAVKCPYTISLDMNLSDNGFYFSLRDGRKKIIPLERVVFTLELIKNKQDMF